MPMGIPKDPNWKPRKQSKNHPWRIYTATMQKKYSADQSDEFHTIKESDFSGYAPKR